MSFPAQVGEQPRTRPVAVSVAGWLLFLVAGLLLILAVVELSQIGTVADAYEAAYRGTGDEGTMRASAIGGSVAVAVVRTLLAIGFVLLAIFNNRGKNPSRIVTWVLGGLAVCCGTLLVIGSAASNSLNLGGGGGDNRPDPADVQRQVNDALPSWYNPISITFGVLTVLALLGAIILLALPPANEYFRKPQPVWQPPVYPQEGGYPQPGGYPAPGTSYPPPAAPPAPGIPPPSWSPPPPAGGPAQPGGPPAGGGPGQPGGPPEAGPPQPGGPPA